MSKQIDAERESISLSFTAIRERNWDALREQLALRPRSLDYLETLVENAAEKGLIPALEILAEFGADVASHNALDAAAKSGKIEVVQWLLDRGTPVNNQPGIGTSTAMWSAAENGHLDIVNLLVNKGAQYDTETIGYMSGSADEEVRQFLETLQPKSPFVRRREAGLLGGVSAAKLAGEADYLAAVVDNPNDETLKLKYADWLEAQQDPRGPFLRKFVAASRSMDLAHFPSSGQRLPADWLTMIGYDLVHEIAVHDLIAQKETILRLARPVAVLEESRTDDDELPIGSSKLGGLPDLSPDVEWPRGVDCTASFQTPLETDEPCGFIGQINCADLQKTLAGRLLPSTGLLSFFASCTDSYGQGEDGIRVLFQPTLEGLQRTSPPEPLSEANEIQPTSALAFIESLELPADDSPWQDELDLPEDNEYFCILEDYDDSLLGYFRANNSEDDTPDRHWRHLLSIRANVRYHIQIHEDDLRARNFDKVKLVWIDYEDCD